MSKKLLKKENLTNLSHDDLIRLGMATIAYNDIKDRKGVMIDDNFVKTKTRESANSSDDSASAIAGD